MRPMAVLAESVRADRHEVSADNPLLALEHAVSDTITGTLDMCSHFRDMMVESFFLNTYGSPLLQALVGLRAEPPAQRRRIERDLTREAAASRRTAELRERIDQGGVAEAVLRARFSSVGLMRG